MSDRKGLGRAPKYVTQEEIGCLVAQYGAVKGEPGCDGRDGRDGDVGPRGPIGPKGDDGKQGCPGIQGIQGPRGERGLDGRNGCDGKDGRDGRDGDRGPQGEIGPEGQKGQDGKDGRDGCCGDEGTPGEQGPQGEKGEKGDQGDQGIQGEKGDKGDTGLTGPAGSPGAQGEKGEKGDKGDKGDTGETGPAGQNGVDGVDGAPGSSVDCTGNGGDGSEANPFTSVTFVIDPQDGSTPQVKTISTAATQGGNSSSVSAVLLNKNDQGLQVVVGNTNNTQVSSEICTWDDIAAQVGSGTQGPPGETGPQGPIGETGPAGEDGADGSIVTISQSGDSTTIFVDQVPYVITSGGGTGTGTVVTCTSGTDAQGQYQELFFDGAPASPACRIYQGTAGETGPQGPIGETGPQGPIGETGPAGQDGLSIVDVQTSVSNPNSTSASLDFNFIFSDGSNITENVAGSTLWEAVSAFAPSTGTGNVTCQTAADPNNPCLLRTTLTVDGTDCFLYPYEEQPQCCQCHCIEVVAGATVTVTGTSVDGFSVAWGENNQVGQVAGMVGGSTSYQYSTAGKYELRLCQNSYCDDVVDVSITGVSTREQKVCDGCS